MKQTSFTRHLWLMLLMLLIPLGAWADREVTQPQFGKQTITVASDEVITFYDWKGTDDISSSSSNNSQSLTVFVPAETGKSIQITFESCDVTNDGSQWYGKVYVYSGNPDADDSFTWATKTGDINASSTMPTGTILAEMDGSYTNEAYTSAASDGSLSVGMLWRYAKACSGWVAKVKVVQLENMTVTGAGSNYDGVVAQPQAKTGLAFANATVTAEGTMNADHVTGIYFTMTQNEGAVDPTALKLFKGDTQLTATVETDGDNYKFVLDEALADGTNTFTIKGDFLGTADVAAKAKIDITNITTTEQPEGVTPFTPGTSIAVENPALVFMSATPQTISVGSIPLTFYDEGGADGKYINDQNDRTITFTPKNEGKVVQIDFSKFDIYYSSWSTPAQFKVYSGTSASGTLLWEPTAQADYTTGPDKTLRGIPADGGAITIVFNAKTTSTYSIKDGWAATVSEYQPVQMVATAIEATQTKTTDASIGGMNEALLTFNVQTEGSLNALSLTAVNIDLKGTNTQIDKLYLYSVGETDKEPTATAVGNVEVSGATATLTLTDAVTLNEGNNYFRLTADVKGSVLPETTIDAAITSIVASEQTINATAGDPEGQRTLKDMILMSSTGNTITVLEGRPIAFYDEGGAEGGIVSKTNGKTTFLSGDADKKVMVDFTTNEIWHGSLYNQELRIYAGQEVKAENLIKTLQQGETGIVRSTAEDGSLTVVLFSDAGNDVAANGWEATVSLFTPQAMDFNGMTTTAASTETVAAGDADQDMLTINVKTLNTEPAMQVTKMAFTAGETAALVSKAALYFGTTKVGETTVEGSSFEITLTMPQALIEGDNLFTLKYTISDEALNGQTVSAQLTSVTAFVNNAEKTETATTEAVQRTVKNIAISHADQGTATKTVNGSLAFETKPRSEYTENYESGSDERVNIFIPKHEGMICQIDFASFAIYYSSYSPSSCAKFKIYAGQGTQGDVLWEPSTSDDYKKGPQQVIRSTAADGALTIVFNPNNTYSSAAGWKATVSEYQSKPMTVNAVEVSQASTADASIGAAGQELLTVNIKTEGDQNALLLSAMTLNLKGTEANISKVSVWQGDTQLGEAAAAAEVSVSFSEPLQLAEGDNAFVVKADVKSNATENSTIDAKVVSITAGTAIEATAGDPDGQRTLKNQVLMTTGSHGTLNLELGQTVSIFDDGGSEGDGADGVEATITIAPTGDAESIKLTCQDIKLSYTAYLYIYEGTEVSDDKLIIDNKGASKPFAPIIVDGPVTIKYVGAGSYTKPNFAIQAEGYKKTDVVVTSVTTEDISVSKVLKGQTDVKMLKIKVEAKGELTPAEITAFNITGADGEAVANYHIYQTGTATTFSPVNVFNGSYSITESGTYYFWLTYDVKAEAAVGQTASAAVTGVVVNGNTINVTEPATATFTVASGKSGTCIIGQGGDYATIQGAIDKIGELGMDGPVTLKIKAGEYNEKVRIPNIKGLGATNTLTLESESGERDVKIYHNNYTTDGYSSDQHKKDYGVVTLYEANYVTLKNLEIYTTDKAYKAVVMVKDESRHATIDNCYLHAPICTASSGEDVVLVGHTIIDEENRNNDYLTVRNCLLEGGKIGVSMGGTSYVSLPKEVGGIIEGNTFKNNGTKAIYVMDELGVKIRNNIITIDADVETKISVGILDMQLRDEYAEATEITGNTFNVAPKTYAAVMNLRQLEGTTDAPVLIANNVINLASLSASYSAFKFNGANIKNVNVANNTFRMTGTNGGAAFWAASTLADGYGNINVVNNIIQNETSGYAVNLYNDGNLGTGKINFQNNLIYTAGETFFRAASSTTGDFAAFVDKTGATGCINKQVEFFEGSCEPKSTLDGDLLTAVALSYVTTDINGTARPAENITIGAYEYDPDVTRIPALAEGYPKASATAFNEAQVAVRADMNGRAYILVLPATDDAPTAETVKADGNVVSLTKDTEATQKFGSLNEKTQYVAYVLVESTRGNATSVMATDAFTTPMEPIELMIACTEPLTTVASGTNTSLKVMVASGLAPFTVTWTDSRHQTVGEPIHTNLLGAEILQSITPTQSGDYYVTVTDAQNYEATDTCRIIVTGEALVADFENLYLADNSHWNGPDTKGDIEEGLYGDQQYQGWFISGSYAFANNYSIDWHSWSGFSYANSTATSFATYTTDQWNNCVGGGHDGSPNYAVFFEDSFAPMTVTVLNNPAGDQLSGFYITNAAWTVDAILNGDGQTGEKDADENSVSGTQGFRQGDYLKLIITADNNEKVEFYLADYRGAAADHYYVSDWQWVDLSTLGTVKELTFHMESSRHNSFGYTTPLYFCMDDFNGTAPVPSAITRPTTDETTDIEGYYDLNGRRIATPQQGVNIVKMKNGATRKVIMK